MTEKRLLLVCGAARSGTTALAELLNKHEAIVLGIERYKYLLLSRDAPDDPTQLFSDERRFFEYRSSDSNIELWKGGYSDLYTVARRKFPTSKYVGDKIPGMYRRYRWLAAKLPSISVLHIVRDPRELAYSWNGRARKGGSWPVENDFTRAIPEWNFAVAETNAALDRGDLNIGVISYQQIFAPRDESAERLMRWLRLPMTDQFEEGIMQIRRKARSLEKRRVLDNDSVNTFVQSNADWDAYERLIGRAI